MLPSLGITFCVAAGDHGSSDYWPLDANQLAQCEQNPTMACAKPPDGHEHVDFPASSPYVLACGGTSLIASNGTIGKEVVWNNNDGWATGGGISVIYPPPDYQKSSVTNKQGRAVPDVSGNADGDTGYNVSVDGEDAVIGGTSAVAPLWAALVAILNQGLNTHIGFINPLLYTKASSAFHDIKSGNNDTAGNGNFSAGTGWDACTGLGSPDGKKILSALI